MTTTLTPEPTTAPNGAVPVSAPNSVAATIARLRTEGFGVKEVAEQETTDGVSPSAPAPADTELPDALPGATQDATGRWRNPDGKFAKAPGDEAVAAVPEGVADATADTTDPDVPEPIVVKIRGRNDGDEELELEVSDPSIAERLRQNANDGMRRAEYNRQMAALEQDRAQLREVAVMLETSPESIVEGMAPERQERVLKYLLASNFDKPHVREVIERWYQDDVSRREDLLGIRDSVRASRAEGERARAGERRAAEIRLAVRELIPPHAADDDAKDFYTDAIAALTHIAEERGDIDPSTVPALLTSRVRRYFGAAPAASPAAVPPAPKVAVARPVGERAEQIAQQQARTQAAQATRRIAAKVAPQGAGAVPTVVDNSPPKGQDIKSRVAWARANISKVFAR